MAMSATHYDLLQRLSRFVPHGGAILEIGEANWYGDQPPEAFGIDAAGCETLFDVAKRAYAKLFAPRRVVSVDFNGTPRALRLDLNRPLPPLGLFDLVINHGTAEHVFDVAQVFASMHNACAVGGLMVHESPFTGWLDHGFYCFQPTLFYDLAAANGYDVLGMAVHEIKSRQIIDVPDRDAMTHLLAAGVPHNAMLFVVLKKTHGLQFRLPVQGYYAQTIGAEASEAWETLR